jgi:hypothetical protein
MKIAFLLATCLVGAMALDLTNPFQLSKAIQRNLLATHKQATPMKKANMYKLHHIARSFERKARSIQIPTLKHLKDNHDDDEMPDCTISSNVTCCNALVTFYVGEVAQNRSADFCPLDEAVDGSYCVNNFLPLVDTCGSYSHVLGMLMELGEQDNESGNKEEEEEDIELFGECMSMDDDSNPLGTQGDVCGHNVSDAWEDLYTNYFMEMALKECDAADDCCEAYVEWVMEMIFFQSAAYAAMENTTAANTTSSAQANEDYEVCLPTTAVAMDHDAHDFCTTFEHAITECGELEFSYLIYDMSFDMEDEEDDRQRYEEEHSQMSTTSGSGSKTNKDSHENDNPCGYTNSFCGIEISPEVFYQPDWYDECDDSLSFECCEMQAELYSTYYLYSLTSDDDEELCFPDYEPNPVTEPQAHRLCEAFYGTLDNGNDAACTDEERAIVFEEDKKKLLQKDGCPEEAIPCGLNPLEFVDSGLVCDETLTRVCCDYAQNFYSQMNLEYLRGNELNHARHDGSVACTLMQLMVEQGCAGQHPALIRSFEGDDGDNSDNAMEVNDDAMEEEDDDSIPCGYMMNAARNAVICNGTNCRYTPTAEELAAAGTGNGNGNGTVTVTVTVTVTPPPPPPRSFAPKCVFHPTTPPPT